MSLYISLTVVVPRGDLLNWYVTRLGKHTRKLVTPTAKDKTPLEPTWIWWAGGQPATTKGDEVKAATSEWLEAMCIPHDTQKIPAVRSLNYLPVDNEGILSQWDTFVPDQSAGRAIRPPLYRKEQAYFTQAERK